MADYNKNTTIYQYLILQKQFAMLDRTLSEYVGCSRYFNVNLWDDISSN